MSNPPVASTSQLNQLITYPKADSAPPSGPVDAKKAVAPKIQVKERLYVGNLHPTVDEHTLIQIFSRYGKLAKLDFLFHKTGPMKGKPRGYAFVEYGSAESAAKALQACDQKLLRGRKINVTYANQAPDSSTSYRPRQSETKTTTLSLMKTSNKPKGMESKIAALEAKLRQLEQERETKSGEGESASEATGEAGLPPRPAHLPPKPTGQ